MRPHRPPPTDDAGRARLALATELGWLAGYPTGAAQGGLGWQIVPLEGAAPSTLRVDRALLSRARRAIRTIWRDHLGVLPTVLGEAPERWRERVETILDFLANSVHKGAETPDPWETPLWDPRLADRVARLPRKLGPLARALGWRLLGDAEAARDALGAIQRQPEHWEALLVRADGLLWAVVLLGWRRLDRDARVDPVLALLTTPTDRVRAWRWHGEWCDVLARRIGLTPGSACSSEDPPWDEVLAGILRELAATPRDVRRRGLELLGAPRPPLQENQAWWRRYDELEARVDRLPAEGGVWRRSHREEDALERWKDALRAEVGRLRESAPAPWHPTALARALPELARAERLAAALLEALPCLAEIESFDAASAFLVAWSDDASSPRRARDAARWARSLARATERGRLAAWLVTWKLNGWTERKRSWRSERAWRELPDPADDLLGRTEDVVRRFYDLLDRAEEPVLPGLALCLIEAMEHTDDEGLARRVASLMDVERPYALSSEKLEGLATLCRLVPMERLRAWLPGHHDEIEELVAAARWLAEGGYGDGLARLDLSSLLPIGATLVALSALGAPAPSLVRNTYDSEWIETRPEEIHDFLHDLSAFHPDPRAIYARYADELWPPDLALDQEIAALTARAGEDPRSPLRRRLDSLRARRAEARPPRPGEVRKLARRLREAADRAMVAQATALLKRSLHASQRARVGLTTAEDADWLSRPELARLFGGLSDAPNGTRELLFQVLRARSGPPPWDLRDEPRNARFLETLRARGVDPAPWLGERQELVRAPTGEAITLALEPDPLEILWMGEHFGTCLSFGGINFFSAVVNAADVNKRVLYARGPGGQVIGRALLALTDEGRILTYEPYCHRRDLDFGARVSAFATALAADMGTTVAPRGAPRPLLFSRWYDDEARDLSGQLDLLREGSDFARALHTLPPDALLPALREALGPVEPSAEVLEMLLDLDVLHDRPELAPPLLPLVARVPGLGPFERARLATLAWKAGDVEGGRAALPRLRPGMALPRLCCHYAFLLDGLIGLDPRYVLLIQRYRDPRQHHLEPRDMFARARALEALHRPAQARALYERVLADSDDHLERLARERLAGLKGRSA